MAQFPSLKSWIMLKRDPIDPVTFLSSRPIADFRLSILFRRLTTIHGPNISKSFLFSSEIRFSWFISPNAVTQLGTEEQESLKRLIFNVLNTAIKFDFRNQRIVKVKKNRHTNKTSPLRITGVNIQFYDFPNRVPDAL
ncbi:hypothetical protein V6Z11_D05G369700 [Gossypium hirsutum]